jgi:hypothetical protein
MKHTYLVDAQGRQMRHANDFPSRYCLPVHILLPAMLPGEFLLKQSRVTQYVLFGQSVLPELNGVVLLLLSIMSLPLFSMI